MIFKRQPQNFELSSSADFHFFPKNKFCKSTQTNLISPNWHLQPSFVTFRLLIFFVTQPTNIDAGQLHLWDFKTIEKTENALITVFWEKKKVERNLMVTTMFKIIIKDDRLSSLTKSTHTQHFLREITRMKTEIQNPLACQERFACYSKKVWWNFAFSLERKNDHCIDVNVWGNLIEFNAQVFITKFLWARTTMKQ